MLRRESFVRRRLWFAGVLAAVLAAQLVAACLMSPHVTRVTTVIRPPIAVAMPIAVPFESPAAIDRPACPPPRLDAPPLIPGAVPEGILAVAPSRTNAGWIAAWNRDHVYVSSDAGATFTRVLDGKGPVRDVTFDCYGRAIVLRDEVGIRDGTRETWHRVRGVVVDAPGDFSGPAAGLIGGGPDIVVVGNTKADPPGRVVVTRDLGATWRFHDLPHGLDGGLHKDGYEDADGAIHLAWSLADCMSDWLQWVKITDRIDADSSGIEEMSTFEVQGDVEISGNRWRRFGQDGWKPIEGLDPAHDNVVALPGPMPTIVDGNDAYRIRGGTAHKLPVSVVSGPAAVDAAGRIWSIACGRPFIALRDPIDLPSYGCGSDI